MTKENEPQLRDEERTVPDIFSIVDAEKEAEQVEDIVGAESVSAEEDAPTEKKSDVGWYVIHTYSGYENKVCDNLKRRISSQDMQDQIFEVLVPVEEEINFTTDSNSGKQKKRTVKKKIYPGYVLVQMKMSDRSWYVVRNTPGVTGFVSPGEKAVPLREEEVESIKRIMGLSAPQKINLNLEIGQVVRVTSGAFKDHHGTVVTIDKESERLRLLLDMFNRQTPVTVEFGQVEKI